MIGVLYGGNGAYLLLNFGARWINDFGTYKERVLVIFTYIFSPEEWVMVFNGEYFDLESCFILQHISSLVYITISRILSLCGLLLYLIGDLHCPIPILFCVAYSSDLLVYIFRLMLRISFYAVVEASEHMVQPPIQLYNDA